MWVLGLLVVCSTLVAIVDLIINSKSFCSCQNKDNEGE